ncbi:flagellar protein FliT [Clostridium sp. MB40-C1]|uniref:flagellar protein FliT n=1 Tax=Clostridium sp. MB40-C1 TaxID=3070996 RepID=UPI0027E10DAE|nr:flagellar protein FliT [Clostridium sp. MB40-C1]WMJ81309.1 flagellar protein FliT [Clostridium sp. MB40-C1]
MELEVLIKEYKKCSLEVLSILDSDNFDSLDELLDKRGEIINNISMLKSALGEVKSAYEKHEIYKLDKLIVEKIELKKDELREKILDVKRRREGTKSYNNFNTRAVFLSKEI